MTHLVFSPFAEESIAALSATRKAEVRRLLQQLQMIGIKELGPVKVSAASAHGYVIRTRSDVRITVLPIKRGTYLVDDVFTRAALPPGAAAKSAFATRPTSTALDRSTVMAPAKKAATNKAAAKKGAA